MDNSSINLKILDNERIEQLMREACSEEYEVCVWGAGDIGKGSGRQLLEENGIKIDYYCDNRKELIDTEIVSGIYCRSIDRLILNAEKTICFILVGGTTVESIYIQLIEAGVKKIATYYDILGLPETWKRHIPFMSQRNTVIYTCITGDYDDVKEPEYISDRCDYYLISDKRLEKDSVFQWLDIKEFVPNDIKDPIYQNRFCKINTSKIFPQYRYSVYVDGNIKVTGDIAETIGRLKKARIGVISDFYSYNFYTYALQCIMVGFDSEEKIMNQIKSYYMQGMPEDVGLFSCGVLVREHNNPICVKLMEDWWKEFCIHSKRDQISLPYVLWKNGFSKEDVMLICDSNGDNRLEKTKYWEYTYNHKKERFRIKGRNGYDNDLHRA